MMSASRSAHLFSTPSLKLTKEIQPHTAEEAEEMERVPYRQAIGSLMYTMVCTRPDLAISVGILSQLMANPGPIHWSAAKRVLRYLRGTSQLGLRFTGAEDKELLGYTDSDWASDADTRRSTSGFVFLLDGGVVSWRSKGQMTAATSTTEAEYMAASHATEEGVWLRTPLRELQGGINEATLILSDSQGSLSLIKNPVFHPQTKHIDIQHHFVRQKVQEGVVKFSYCRTEDMAADVFTKALPKQKFEKWRKLIGINLSSQSGSVERV